MTIADEIAAELRADGCVAQAQPAAQRATSAHAVHRTLGAVIGPAVDGEVYQLQQPDSPAYPNVTFQPVGYERIGPDGLPLIRSDRYELHIRAPELGPLIESVDQMRDALIVYRQPGSAIGFDVTDQALDTEYTEKIRRALMAVEVYSLATESQLIPAAFVYAAGMGASEARTATVTQTVEHHYHIAIIAPGEQIDTAQRAVTAALLGFIPSAGDYATGLALVGGDLLQHYGPLALWRNTYVITEYTSA